MEDKLTTHDWPQPPPGDPFWMAGTEFQPPLPTRARSQLQLYVVRACLKPNDGGGK